MKIDQNQIPKIATYVLTGLSVIILMWWVNYDPTRDFTQSLPGMDNRGSGVWVIRLTSAPSSTGTPMITPPDRNLAPVPR